MRQIQAIKIDVTYHKGYYSATPALSGVLPVAGDGKHSLYVKPHNTANTSSTFFRYFLSAIFFKSTTFQQN